MNYATITSLNVYPVKSCRGIALEEAQIQASGIEGDRRWMIVNEAGRFLTQRELPRMALITPAVAIGGLSLTAPGMPALTVPDPFDGLSLPVTIFAHRCTAIDAGPNPAEWLTRFLGRTVRLVRFDPRLVRPIDSRLWTGDIEAHVTFPDAFPLLLIAQKSLDDLNSRLEIPLPMSRFRPNAVLEGLGPYEEDRIHELRAGGLRLQMAMACTRCKITTTDQLTGESSTAEPLITLRGYRWNSELRGVMFGRYAVVAGAVGSQLRTGQQLEIAWK
jgi:hypothetical protein